MLLLIMGLTGEKADFSYGQKDLREASATKNALLKTRNSANNNLEAYYASQLENLNIKLRPGTEHRPDSKETPNSGRRCRSLVFQTLMDIPMAHRDQLSELTLFYAKNGRRGLGGNGAVVLRCLNIADNELKSVLTHEIGHLVDAGYLLGFSAENSSYMDFDDPVPADDPSAIFYAISWETDKKQKQEASAPDFVSGYGSTDSFEDFAETYTYYRWHGAEFRSLAQINGALNQKYEFMKNYVFNGTEYGLDSNNSSLAGLNFWERPYDATVIPF